MSESLPAPLVPSEADLRDFQYMELDVRVLRDSRFAAQVSGDAFRAGVLLWCAAWHQVPAGSLPDDDIELANLAGYGRFVKEWKKVRAEALMQFVKCSDGRLYHETVCAKVAQAWTAKLRHHYDRACDRLRKANKLRKEKGEPLLPELTFDQWNERRIAAGLPMERADASAGIPQKGAAESAGIPAENALRGNGEGKGEGEGDSYSVPDGTGAAAAAPVDAPPIAAPPPEPPDRREPPPAALSDRDLIFANGLPLLTATGVSDKNARSFLAAQCKAHGDAAVRQALDRCAAAAPLQPVPWLQAALKAPPVSPVSKPDRIALTNAETVRRFAQRTGT